MTRKDVEEQLIKSIRAIQELSGRSARGISLTSVPLQDIEGFDSLNAIEALCDLRQELKREFKGDINLWAPKSTKRRIPVNLREVAQNISNAIGLAKE